MKIQSKNMSIDLTDMLKGIKETEKAMPVIESKAFSKIGQQAISDCRKAQRGSGVGRSTYGYVGGFQRKKSRPSEFLEQITRWQFDKRFRRQKISSIRIGVFASARTGLNRRSTLTNAKFKKRFGVTVRRLGEIMSYGGRLRITARHRREMVEAAIRYKRGQSSQRFHFLRRETQYLEFRAIRWAQVFKAKEMAWFKTLDYEMHKRIGHTWATGRN